jgi:hypothetical protein
MMETQKQPTLKEHLQNMQIMFETFVKAEPKVVFALQNSINEISKALQDQLNKDVINGSISEPPK